MASVAAGDCCFSGLSGKSAAAGGSEYAGAARQNLFLRSCRASVSVIGMNAIQTKQRNMEFSLMKPVNEEEEDSKS